MVIKHTDTRKICDDLKAKKFTPNQANALTDIFKDHDDGYHENFITKDDVEKIVRGVFWKVVGELAVVIGCLAALGALIYAAMTYSDQINHHEQSPTPYTAPPPVPKPIIHSPAAP